MLDNTKIAYTVNEGMAALGIGRTKFYELARAGKIDLRNVGGRTVATAASLHRLVEQAEVWSPTDHPQSDRQRNDPKGGRHAIR